MSNNANLETERPVLTWVVGQLHRPDAKQVILKRLAWVLEEYERREVYEKGAEAFQKSVDNIVTRALESLKHE